MIGGVGSTVRTAALASMLVAGFALGAARVALAQTPANQTEAGGEPPAAELTEAPPTPAPRPTRIGPFEIRLGDQSRLGIGFAVQIRTSVANDGGTFGTGGRTTNETVEFRRVRVSLRGSFFDEKLRLTLQLSTAPNSLELLDAAIDVAASPHAVLRFGQFKTPFTLHRARAFTNLPLTDWDISSTRFGSERQLGVQVARPADSRAPLDYAVGVFSGQNARASFARGIAEAYAEPMPNPSNLRVQGVATELHPELIGRVGYGTRGMELMQVTDAEGSPLRAYGALSAAFDARPTEALDFSLRLAAECIVKFRHVTANFVHHEGFYEGGGHGSRLAMLGEVAELTYRFHPRFEVAARFARVDVTSRLRGDARTRADALIAAAAPAQVAAVTKAYETAGELRHQQEYGVGFNAYCYGRSLAVQSDFTVIRTDRLNLADQDSWRMRVQLQLAL